MINTIFLSNAYIALFQLVFVYFIIAWPVITAKQHIIENKYDFLCVIILNDIPEIYDWIHLIYDWAIDVRRQM